MGVYILEYTGFAKHVDQLLEEEHTSIEKLKEHYQDPEKSFFNQTSILAKPVSRISNTMQTESSTELRLHVYQAAIMCKKNTI